MMQDAPKREHKNPMKTEVSIQDQIDKIILPRQNKETGLFPASTAVNSHGDYRDAWVRDNIYTSISVWAAWLVAKKSTPASNLEQDYKRQVYQHSVVSNMRGLLSAMMRQAQKVELFKNSQNSKDALHAKYSTQTGEVVVGDDEWGHLQLDATSLYLLMLAQMTASGLTVIKTHSECNFVQNLVYYIGKGYQIADYGIWERGNKINDGSREIHASSVGMVKSALQAIRSVVFTLEDDSSSRRITVNDDEIARCRVALYQLLPRESFSKEVDAANLSITGFPGFSIEDQDLLKNTEQKIRTHLSGNYGYKRFLLDGHQSVLEDSDRLYYNEQETKNFEHIESEWPLFFVYEYLNALIRDDFVKAVQFKQKIERTLVDHKGLRLLPELYYVSEDNISLEKQHPGSQVRVANHNLPLIWAQSLYYLASLLDSKQLTADDLDPLGLRSHQTFDAGSNVNIVFIAENNRVKENLALKGICSDVPDQVENVAILASTEYYKVFSTIGKDDSLQLSGTPRKRRPQTLSTAKVYQIDGRPSVFIPGFQNRTSFYFASDYAFLADKMRAEIQYLHRHWNYKSTPFMLFLVTEEMLDGQQSETIETISNELLSGRFGSTGITLCHLTQAIDSAQVEGVNTQGEYQFPQSFLPRRLKRKFWLHFNPQASLPVHHSVLTFLEPESSVESNIEKLKSSDNIYEQLDLLMKILVSKGEQHCPGFGNEVTVVQLIEEVYFRASLNAMWNLTRKTAAVLGKYWGSLEDSVSEILSRQKMLVVGRSFHNMGLIRQPQNNQQILDILKKNTGYDEREAIINQEIIVLLAILMKEHPESFDHVLTLRTGQIAQLIMTQLTQEADGESSEAFDQICSLSPYELLQHVKQVVNHYSSFHDKQFLNEAILLSDETLGAADLMVDTQSDFRVVSPGDSSDWNQWRNVQGVMPRLDKEFYQGLWALLGKCHGIVIGNRFDSQTRIDSDMVLNTFTSGETQFVHLFEMMINRIDSASYRQMTIEALEGLITFSEMNPSVEFKNHLIIEVILGHAVRINWLSHSDHFPENYDDEKGDAWKQFYLESTSEVTVKIQNAVQFLIETGLPSRHSDDQPHAELP